MARRAWPVGSRTFPTRAAARAYAKAQGLPFPKAEYQRRITERMARGMTRAEARSHGPTAARHVPKHRKGNRKGAPVVREVWAVGAAGSGEEITVRQALRRLGEYHRQNPEADTVGIALHGKPYKSRTGVVRWTGFVQAWADFVAQLEDARDDGIEDLAEVSGLSTYAAWESIDEMLVYKPA